MTQDKAADCKKLHRSEERHHNTQLNVKTTPSKLKPTPVVLSHFLKM